MNKESIKLICKGMFEQRSRVFDGLRETTVRTCTSAHSIQKFTITARERKEFEEVYKQMTELKPEESIPLGTTYIHAETGLLIGTNDGHTYHTELGMPTFHNPKEIFYSELFVVGTYFDTVVQYYVKNPGDILKLYEIIKQGSSTAFIAVSSDAVGEMMGAWAQ